MAIPADIAKDMARKGSPKEVSHKARSKRSAKFKADISGKVDHKETQGTKNVKKLSMC